MNKRNRKKIIAYALVGAMSVVHMFGGGVSSSAAKRASVKLNKTSVTVKKGKKVTLKVVKKNVKKVKGIKWSVKNKKIATVSKKGVVKGVKTGKTTVTCKLQYQEKGKKKFQKKTLKCNVTVRTGGGENDDDKEPTSQPTTNAAVSAKPTATTAAPAAVTSAPPAGSSAPVETTKPDETAGPTETTKPDETTAPTETTKPDETSGPDETAEPIETTKPDETAGPAETSGPDETAGPTETAKPDETSEPDETAAPTEKPDETTAPVETAKPTATTVVGTAKPTATTAVGTAKPTATTAVETTKPVATPTGTTVPLPDQVPLKIDPNWKSGQMPEKAVDKSNFATCTAEELTGKKITLTYQMADGADTTMLAILAGAADENQGGVVIKAKESTDQVEYTFEITEEIAVALISGGLYVTLSDAELTAATLVNGGGEIIEPTGTPVVPTPTGEPEETTEPTGTPEATPTGEPEETSEPTQTPEATPTGEPEETSEPTQTPEATPTGEPEETSEPTETPEPTATAKPTQTPLSCYYWQGSLESSETTNYAYVQSTTKSNMIKVTEGSEVWSPLFTVDVKDFQTPTLKVVGSGYGSCIVMPLKEDGTADTDNGKTIWSYDNAATATKDLTELIAELGGTKIAIEYKGGATAVYVYDAATVSNPEACVPSEPINPGDETRSCYYWQGSLEKSETTEYAYVQSTTKSNMIKVTEGSEVWSPLFTVDVKDFQAPTLKVVGSGYGSCIVMSLKEDGTADTDNGKTIWSYDNAATATKDLTELIAELGGTKIAIEYKGGATAVYVYDAAAVSSPEICVPSNTD